MTSQQSRRYPNAIELLLVSEVCSFAFAITYTVVRTLSLPPSDLAYGQAPFADPFVVTIMSVAAGVAGLLAWPFVYFTLRRRGVSRGLLLAGGLTLTWIIIVTPLNGAAGMLGSFVVFVGGLVASAVLLSPLPIPGHCGRCGYDLTGNSSGRCPECGTCTSREADATPHRDLYCLGCGYDLARLNGPRCPECGRAFDHGDPDTMSRSPNSARWHRLREAVAWLYWPSMVTGCLGACGMSACGAPLLVVAMACGAAGMLAMAVLVVAQQIGRIERKAQLGLLRVPPDDIGPRQARNRVETRTSPTRLRLAAHWLLWILLASTAATQWPLYLSFYFSRGALDEFADRVGQEGATSEPEWVGIFCVERSSEDLYGQVSLWLWPWSTRSGGVGFIRSGTSPTPSGRYVYVCRLADDWYAVAED